MDNQFEIYMQGQLKGALSDIEMPERYYEKAETAYKSLSEYLVRSESSLSGYSPDIILQGSIKTGTAIKPVTDDGSYDVDIVCVLNNLSVYEISQSNLKTFVGNEVKSYAKAHAMKNVPHDGKRCWTLDYIDDANFHMDILPALLGKYSLRIENGELLVHTDSRLDSYSLISSDWPTTNPSGYANWFLRIADVSYHRERMAKVSQASIEDLKVYQVKAPLQQYVQLLKRHRDIWFSEKYSTQAQVPKSIVITTLAGRAYENLSSKGDWYTDFKRVLDVLPSFIKQDNGTYVLSNPSNADENFLKEMTSEDFDVLLRWAAAAKDDLATIPNVKNGFAKQNARNQIRSSLGLESKEGSSLLGSLADISSKVFSLAHHQSLSYPMCDIVKVDIRAEYCRNGGVFKRFSSNQPLPKGADLRFYALADNLKSYEVKWQVTNDGEEAIAAHCLRGDFYGEKFASGRRFRPEKTCYKGQHYVECYLLKDNVCYGKSEPFIVNIGSD